MMSPPMLDMSKIKAISIAILLLPRHVIGILPLCHYVFLIFQLRLSVRPSPTACFRFCGDSGDGPVVLCVMTGCGSSSSSPAASANCRLSGFQAK
jgi:hypothetical protein